MALLSRELGILFIMAPHTGSTPSARAAGDFGAEYLPQARAERCPGHAIPRKHTSLAAAGQYSGLLEAAFDDPADASACVIVSTIRNPFDSNVSSWHRWYRKLDPNHVEFNASFRDRARGTVRQPPTEIDEARADFEDWLVSRYQPSRLMRLRTSTSVPIRSAGPSALTSSCNTRSCKPASMPCWRQSASRIGTRSRR